METNRKDKSNIKDENKEMRSNFDNQEQEQIRLSHQIEEQESELS